MKISLYFNGTMVTQNKEFFCGYPVLVQKN